MAIFESPETNLEDEYFSVLLQIYERIIHHEAFTLAQKQRVMAWKRTVKKVFSPTLPRRRASYQFPSSGTERRGAGVPPTAGLPAGCLQPAPFASPSMRAAGACSPDRHRRMAPANGRWMQMIHSPSSPSNAPFPAAPVTVEQFALLRDMMAMQQFQLLSMAAHRYSVQALYDQQQQQQQQNGQQQPQQQQPHRVSQPHPQNQQPTSMNGRTWPPELSRHNSAPPNVSQPPLHTQSVHTQSHHKFASTPTSPPVTTASNAPSGVCQSQQFNQLAASLAAANFPHQPAQQRSSGNVGPQQQLSQSQQAPTKQQQQQPSQWPPGLGMDNSPLWTTSTTTNTSDSLVSPVPRPIKAHTFPTGSATATSNQGGSLSGGSDRSGAESPLGLMVYNFCGSQFELDKMCRSVAEMTLDLGSTGIQSKEIAGGY
uniref:Uncharacterized protein n=1 Tax=Plectus sambesii TaxID=2011161 RepID=A0A914XF09_9BILA